MIEKPTVNEMLRMHLIGIINDCQRITAQAELELAILAAEENQK